jgi:hypothetical protein
MTVFALAGTIATRDELATTRTTDAKRTRIGRCSNKRHALAARVPWATINTISETTRLHD